MTARECITIFNILNQIAVILKVLILNNSFQKELQKIIITKSFYVPTYFVIFSCFILELQSHISNYFEIPSHFSIAIHRRIF